MLGDNKEDILEREFLLNIVKDENGKSFQLVFDLLSRDSSQFMGDVQGAQLAGQKDDILLLQERVSLPGPGLSQQNLVC